jgi:hypothetical protein
LLQRQRLEPDWPTAMDEDEISGQACGETEVVLAAELGRRLGGKGAT